MKQHIELSPRLRLAADLVPQGARLADVGTDHAYLPACLLLEGKIPWAIASDLRKGPLDRARETARQYGCGDKMAFRLCNGLAGIRPGEADAIVIAGMGGETIAQILEAAPWVLEEKIPLILQPMSSLPELREWLGQNGYAIAKEQLAQETEHYLKMWDEAKKSFALYKENAAKAAEDKKESEDKYRELEARCSEFKNSFFDLQMENMQLKNELEKYRRSADDR